MKRVLNFLYSSKVTIVLLIILAVALGVATFIEDKYDTPTAKLFVYNALWFEFLFLLLFINLIGHIKSYNLLRKEKIGGLMFHLAFVVMILGAGITRYFGTEGTMHIRKGESSNIIYGLEPYLLINVADKNKNLNYEIPANYNQLTKTSLHLEIPSSEKGNITIEYNNCLKNAVEQIQENVSDGIDVMELTVASSKGREIVYISKGENLNLGKITLAFNNFERKDAILITEKDGILKITSPFELVESSTTDRTLTPIKKDSTAEFKINYIYSADKAAMFLCSRIYKSAKKVLISGSDEENTADALILDITIKGKKHQATVYGGPGMDASFMDLTFDDVNFKISYGNKPTELPFSLYLREFILERYAGSESPSSYASEVTLTDNRKNLKEDHRIYMNNILDYNMYRFFQSSYDKDEQGTILSVNHDFWGTWVSYFGYFLLCLGFIITLGSKNSRFLSLRRSIVEVRNKRKASLLTILIILGLNSFTYSQNSKVIDASHAEKFGRLLNQSFVGRFEPVNSLALDVMHKISRRDKFNIEGKGEMNALQALLDIQAEPDLWKKQNIIYIKEKAVKDILGVKEKYASLNDFFNEKAQYKIQEYAEEAFRKKPSEQNLFDKEIIKVDERINIFMMAINGSLLKIFPEQGSPNNKWISSSDNSAAVPLQGAINLINEDLKLEKLTYANIMKAYIFEIQNGIKTGDFSKADKIIGYISNIQRQGSIADVLPSETKIKVEIFYNNANIFVVLKNVYGLLSVILLLLAFTDNVRTKKNKTIGKTLNILTVVLGLAFIYHTLGMGIRWYLTEHAPWSNGYEALILVAWGSIIAGFVFAKNSKITLAATVLLAFFVLMTASHSSYDPQLTNLQPVLKSYWLIIHVATLTISYAFLGLGFVLGFMNLFIYLFKTEKNYVRLDLLIKELTYINEMNLTIGIVLATIGTFLGGIWANESWGRYWGWDAKETWALIITLTYALILHIRFIPKLKGIFLFNVASIIGFSSVIMTFIGVNYYLSKGMHTYGKDSTPVFPFWAWIMIFSVIILIIISWLKERSLNKRISK